MRIDVDKLSNVLRELNIKHKDGNVGTAELAERIAERSEIFITPSDYTISLIKEYRGRMGAEVVHDWARDIVKNLKEEFGIADEPKKDDPAP